jgi:hypothetical protein
MPHPPPTLSPDAQPLEHDPVKRLSLAVKELNRLINRAQQLAHPPIPPSGSTLHDAPADSRSSIDSELS